MFTNVDVSFERPDGDERGKSLNRSQTSSENVSKMLFLQLPKKLGMIDKFYRLKVLLQEEFK